MSSCLLPPPHSHGTAGANPAPPAQDLAKVLQEKVDAACTALEKRYRQHNNARDRHTSLRETAEKTSLNASERLPDTFPPAAKGRPPLQLHTAGGRPLEEIACHQEKIDTAHRNLHVRTYVLYIVDTG